MRIIFRGSCLFFLTALFISCQSVSWGTTWSRNIEAKHTIILEKITVDRIGDWSSVEDEITGLAPLDFAEKGYRIADEGEAAEYAVDICAREREFSAGWQTKRSLSMEVRIWLYRDGVVAGTLPLAAGQVTSLGNQSFSSTETTSRMLKSAINRAEHALESFLQKTAEEEKSVKKGIAK
jgi:hypothetical protein